MKIDLGVRFAGDRSPEQAFNFLVAQLTTLNCFDPESGFLASDSCLLSLEALNEDLAGGLLDCGFFPISAAEANPPSLLFMSQPDPTAPGHVVEVISAPRSRPDVDAVEIGMRDPENPVDAVWNKNENGEYIDPSGTVWTADFAYVCLFR
jgi:hypothetical protein